MNKIKKVSIIVPTYNRNNLLKASIESILKQEYANIEVIICDNASSDNTTETVNSFDDDRIVYFRQSENIGMARNHNKALELCTGEYIHIFSDDDIMLQGCIQKKVDILNLYPSVGLVHSDINIIDGDGIVTSEDHWAKKAWKKWASLHSESKLFPNTVYHKYLYRIRNTIAMPSVMIRKGVLDDVGYMDTRLNYLIDLDFWLKITLFADVYYVNEKLVSYRLYATNVFNTISKEVHKKENTIAKNNIKELFPHKSIITNSVFQDILQDGGYYTNYNIVNPLNHLIKKAFPFIPFKKIKNFFGSLKNGANLN